MSAPVGKLQLPTIGEALGTAPLRALYDALRLTGDILEGLINQPRFKVAPGRNEGLNAAGEYLDALREAAMVAADDLADVARRRNADDAIERADLDSLILTEEVRMYESSA